MNTATWKNIVAETQFATELSLNGLRRLCTVPSGEISPIVGADAQNYALHVGLYSYTSGLERLCKLAISCYGYVLNGKFSKLQKNHNLGALLDEVETLDLTRLNNNNKNKKYLKRPTDPLLLEAIDMATRFATAKDGGRYEHLDSLLNDNIEVKTYAQWTELATKVTVSSQVKEMVSLKEGMSQIVESLMIKEQLESVYSSILPDDRTPIYVPSVGVVLTLFRLVRWASAVLVSIQGSQNTDMPVIGEVLSPQFILPSEAFFTYNIARFSDETVVTDELVAAYSRHNLDDLDEDEEFIEPGVSPLPLTAVPAPNHWEEGKDS